MILRCLKHNLEAEVTEKEKKILTEIILDENFPNCSLFVTSNPGKYENTGCEIVQIS